MDRLEGSAPQTPNDSAPPPPAPPGSGIDYQNAAVVADLFKRCTAANLDSPLRKGATIHLPEHGRVTIPGDLHDNAINLERILKLAALHESPDHHLVLHELIHGKNRVNGRDFSVRMLARAAAIKLQFPNQVHIVQANHELAQIAGEGIMKGGISVVQSFNEGVEYIYGEGAPAVQEAMSAFIRSFPLAVRCPHGIFFSHSLPSPRKLPNFDDTVIDRVPTEEDLQFGGSAYLMVWGRDHDHVLAEELADAWGVKTFVMGHQPAESGYFVEADCMLVLASDHLWGVALQVALDRDYTLDELQKGIVPLSQVKLE